MKTNLLFILLVVNFLQAQFVPITNGAFNTNLNGWSITGFTTNSSSGTPVLTEHPEYWGISYNTDIGNGSGHLRIDNLTPFSNGQEFILKSPAFHVDALKSYFLQYDFYHYQFDMMMGGLQPLGDGLIVKIKKVSDDSQVIPSSAGFTGQTNLLNGFDNSLRGVYSFLSSGNYYIEFKGLNSNLANYHFDNVGLVDAFVTKVQSSQCGTTLSLINNFIVANTVSGAQGYRFKVTNLATNQVQTIDKTFNSFRITDLPNFAYNTSYKIEIALKINNVWLTYYGLPCTVSTPIITTQITSSQCGATVSSFAQSIFADIVPYATGYQFKITNLTNPAPSQIVNKNLRAFSLSDFTSPTVAYDSNYSVEVAVKNTDGTYLPFGTLCTISTPTFPTTQLQTSQCNYTVANKNEVIYANAVSGTTLYKFRLTNSTLGYSQSVDRILRTFTLSQFTGLQISTTYNVEVSLKIGGVFGPFGPMCTISTPAVLKTTPSDTLAVYSEKLNSTIYPNPFNESFKINLNSDDKNDVSIKVYDMMGIIVENKTIKFSEIETFELGNNFKSGIYNVVINQAENSKMIRIIKR